MGVHGGTENRNLAWTRFTWWLLLLLLPGTCRGQQPQPSLGEMSIEQLLQIKVISAAKKEQPLVDTAAAVYVITQEEIRRSGVTSVPEALRLAPGVEVGRISGNAWAISIRGFNYRYADKVLVLVDGRTVYSPIFSGVFWELNDLLLEDIDRIEVIRGPGGTMWGANAMNGVISIITRRAQETQGGLVTAAGGSQGYAAGGARWGASTSGGLAYRFYGRYSRLGSSPGVQSPGPDAYDAWDLGRVGFRADWAHSSGTAFTFSGDLFRGSEEDSFPQSLLTPPYFTWSNYKYSPRGGNLLARWERRLSGRSDIALQGFYDRVDRPIVLFDNLNEVFDLDFQHHLRIGERQDAIYGLGLRATRTDTRGTFAVSLAPARLTLYTFNGFIQNEVVLLPSRLWLTVGSKFESNEYTGFEIQPNLRLRWEPNPEHILWAAVSRAVTIPNDFQEIGRKLTAAFTAPDGTPVAVMLTGNGDLKAQSLLAYEAGYRVQPAPKVALDLAGFYNVYGNYIDARPGTPFFEPSPPPPHLLLPLYFGNNVSRRSYGLEFTTTYAPARFWKVSASYSWLVEGSYLVPDPARTPFRTGDDAHNQFQVHSYVSLTRNLEFDTSLFYVNRLAAQSVPGYLRLDTRLGWRPASHLEFSIGAQNLTDPRHPEFLAPMYADWGAQAQVPRSAYAKVTWRF